MKNRILPFLLFLFILCTSCNRIILGMAMKDSIEEQVKTLENKENSRTIVFIPVWHIGKPQYYESVKTIVDSLRREDYIVFYEGGDILEPTDSVYTDTIKRKFRKLIGFHLSNSYKDSTNKSIPKV